MSQQRGLAEKRWKHILGDRVLFGYSTLYPVSPSRAGTLSSPEQFHSLTTSEYIRQCHMEYLGWGYIPEVAKDPVLHTVKTFNPVPSSPLPTVSFTSHSPPHLDISLFLPISSSATSRPSVISNCAISSGDLPSLTPVLSTSVSRRVAAPRLTAVGLAVKRKSSLFCTWSWKD